MSIQKPSITTYFKLGSFTLGTVGMGSNKIIPYITELQFILLSWLRAVREVRPSLPQRTLRVDSKPYYISA